MNKLRINKLGIISVAKMYGLMMFVISLLISIPYGLFIIIFALSGASGLSGNQSLALGGGGIVFGIVLMIAIPIVYGLIGFVAGLIGALVYNVFAGIVGGIEIEVENVLE